MPKKDFDDTGFSSSFFSNSVHSVSNQGSGIRATVNNFSLYDQFDRPSLPNPGFNNPNSNQNSDVRDPSDPTTLVPIQEQSYTTKNAEFSTSDIKDLKKILINLELINGTTLKTEQTDVKKLPNVEVSVNENNEVQLSSLSTLLVSWNMIPTKSLLFYKDYKENMFVHAGDQLDDNLFIPLNKEKQLTIKFRKIISMNTSSVASGSVYSFSTTADECMDDEEEKINPESDGEEEEVKKRIKERNIREIMEKVLEWRQYYQGHSDENGNFVKLKLEDAAKKVGISKKTLDDYLLQIRFGLKYKFDFEQNMSKKVGVLRTFVKTKRQAEGKQVPEGNKNNQKYDQIDIENIKEILRRSYGKGKKVEPVEPLEIKEEIQIEHPPVEDLRNSCFRPSMGLIYKKDGK